MPLLPHFGTYNLQQQKASKFKFLLQQKFGFFTKISCQQVILGMGFKNFRQDSLEYHRLISQNGYINAGIREKKSKLTVSTYKRGKTSCNLISAFL